MCSQVIVRSPASHPCSGGVAGVVEGGSSKVGVSVRVCLGRIDRPSVRPNRSLCTFRYLCLCAEVIKRLVLLRTRY